MTSRSASSSKAPAFHRDIEVGINHVPREVSSYERILASPDRKIGAPGFTVG